MAWRGRPRHWFFTVTSLMGIHGSCFFHTHGYSPLSVHTLVRVGPHRQEEGKGTRKQEAWSRLGLDLL